MVNVHRFEEVINGREYLKNFTLRAIGQHIEVWVASDQDSVSKDLEFPAGDCRNDCATIFSSPLPACCTCPSKRFRF